ncbi:MAG: hypothetical protein ACYDA8_18955, partial [Deferrisomatales bacterium]
DAGLVAVFTLPGLAAADRDRVRQAVGPKRFLEVYVDTPPELCSPHASGAVAGPEPLEAPPDEPYDPPASPDLTLPLHRLGTEEAADQVVALLASRGLLKGAVYLGGAGI